MHFRSEEQKQFNSDVLACSADTSERATTPYVKSVVIGLVSVSAQAIGRKHAYHNLCADLSTLGIFIHVCAPAPIRESRSMTSSPLRLPPRDTETVTPRDCENDVDRGYERHPRAGSITLSFISPAKASKGREQHYICTDIWKSNNSRSR